MTSQPRKKQPEQVRLKLLQATAEIIAQHGLEGVTTAEVAKRAGVTSGGLFHHFPSKKHLIDELINAFMGAFEAHLEELIKQDPDPRGRFTRAYLHGCLSFEHPLFNANLLEAIWSATNRDENLCGRWMTWVDKQLAKYGLESDPILSAIIRYATDGLSMEAFTMASLNAEKRQLVINRLVEWTRQL